MVTGNKTGDASQDAPGIARPWYVYIVRCSDGTLYTGCTTDVSRRIDEHNFSKRGAKYTRSRRPVLLLRFWSFESRSEAQREEMRIKGLPREQKLALTQHVRE